MKKTVLLLLMMAIVWSCNRHYEDPQQLTEYTPIINYTETEAHGDKEWNLLGYGYDVTGAYGTPLAARLPVLDIKAILDVNPRYLTVHRGLSSGGVSRVGENAEEYSLNISNWLTETKDNHFFKGQLEFYFGATDKFPSRYVYASYADEIIYKRIGIIPNYSQLREFLQDDFKRAILEVSPEEIVSLYGTHILLDIFLGAKFEIMYQAETSSIDRRKAAETGLFTARNNIFGAGAHILLDLDFNHVTNSTNAVLKFKSYGGGLEIPLTTVPLSNTIVNRVDISQWWNSCNEDNATMIGIHENGLIPISEFIDNPAKKQQVENYIKSYYQKRKVENNYEVLSIYRYYHPSKIDHYYSREETHSIPGGWLFEREEFKAHVAPAPGAMPVYEYKDNKNVNHFYELGNPRYVHRYQYEGIKFYAYETNVTGTIPVYRYYHNKKVNHFYTTVRRPYEGYTYEGVAFYAFPK
jgi:hypothetical protein